MSINEKETSNSINNNLNSSLSPLPKTNTLSTNVSRTDTAVDNEQGLDDITNKPHFDPGQINPSSRRGTRDNVSGGASGSGGNFEAPSSLKRRFTDLLISERVIKKEPTFKESFIAIVRSSYINLFLVFIPIGWICHFLKVNDTIVFVTTFLAIMPLASLLGLGTEEISLRVGQTLGGLLSATLGNAVELIVAIIALVKCELQVVQSSLLGSILSNLLLVLGMSFFAGGVRFSEQGFKDTAAQLNSSLLVISVIAILIPAGYNAAFSATQSDAAEIQAILSMSRGASIILLFVYGAYLIFQLFTHQHLYADGSGADTEAAREGRSVWGLKNHRALRQAKSARKARRDLSVEEEEEEEGEEEVPVLNLYSALLLLGISTVFIAFTAEFLVSSINGLVAAHPAISVEWIGLILLPLVGNAAEHFIAVSVSVHDKIDLSMQIAVGSSIQIALFVIPFMVTLGWCIGKPLSLLFDPFESIVLFLSVLITNYTISDGKSNWLEGFLLMSVYLIIATAFWFYPASGSTTYTC